jgi:alkylhydroperoxidase family enzyme
MRLEPIDTPPTLLARIASALLRRQLGKVITPARVLYNRVPALYGAGWKLVKAQREGLLLAPELRLLVQSWVAMVNHCSFCVDIARASAIYDGVLLERLDALPEWRTSPLFGPPERAALAYAEEATRNKRVSDETFAALREHFDDRAIVEITFLTALENYYNLLNLPLGIEEDGLCAIARGRLRSA